MQSTRKEALLVGDTHYNTGKPCKKGHISIRLTNSGACKECANHRQKTVRKNSYDPNSRESKSNEYWTGKEGLDGITSLPVNKKD